MRWLVFTRARVLRPLDASDNSLFLNLMLGDLIQSIGKGPFFFKSQWNWPHLRLPIYRENAQY